MTRTITTLVIVFMLAAAGGNAGAAEADASPKQAAVTLLQQAVRANDKDWLAAHARYPVRYFGKRKFLIRDKAAFINNFHKLFGARLRAALLAQDPADVFENWQGLMIGDGSHNVWIAARGEGENPRYLIVTINDGP